MSTKDNRDTIIKDLKEDMRSIKWLAAVTGIPYSTLYFCLKKKMFKVSEKNILKINKAMDKEYKIQNN